MKKIIFIILLGISQFCEAQTQPPSTVFNGVLYQYRNSLRIDSNLFVPKRDTVGFNSALSAPGNIRWRPADSSLYYFRGNKWISLATQSPLGDYLTFSTKMTPLVTQPGIPIQPTDSLTQALGKLQQQINDFDGAFIDNQGALYQIANAKIDGSFHARANSYQFIAERPAITTADAVMGFLTNGVIKGYMGLGSRENEDIIIQASADKIGIQHNPDTGSIYFQEVRVSPAYSDVYATFKEGKMKLGFQMEYNDIANYPIEIVKDGDTSIWAIGKIRAAGTTLRNDGEVLKIRANTQATSTEDLSLSFYDANGTLIGQQGFISSDNKFWTYSPQPVQLLSDQYIQVRPRAIVGNIADDGVTSLQITGANGYNLLRLLQPYTPSGSADANGLEGSIARDDDFIYIKTSTGWKRAALSAF